ncbi:MAG: M3 family oligoendopeptidase [Candidatus Delongbacteria bacterium]|nr:M3 family oligoendopeptidase [Candidatus Delongbacteria bacterium]MBN2834806.1 M3 family oligoendopeptidase [Candidatus Delongbacteria bacterium]
MEHRWNLDVLYKSFQDENLVSDLEKLDTQITSFSNWVKNHINEGRFIDSLKTYIKFKTEINNTGIKLYAFGGLASSTNTKDTNAENLLEKLDLMFVKETEPNVLFTKWLHENKSQMENLDRELDDFRFYFEEIIRSAEHMLSEKEEIVLATMKGTGSNAWTKLQGLLTSTLLVDIEDDGEMKKLPLAVVRNMAYDDKKEIREKAYKAELESYKKIEDSVASALNAIKGEVIEEVKLRGYVSALDKTLESSRMDKETLDAMISAMQDSLPMFVKYFRKKATILGYENGLPFFELFAPLGEATGTYTYEEASSFVVDKFSSFSKELADYAKNAFENSWIDVEPKEGKVGGAFCYNIRPVKESRILTNFTGSLSDIFTLAHELGHGYHGYCLDNSHILNTNYPMPLAETASIFCETIVNNAILENADDDMKLKVLESSISDAAQVVVDIYSRYLFETSVFENRVNGSISVEKLKSLMIEAQKNSYGEGLDPNFMHPYMWLCKGHYYSAGNNFYNFPYAFGLLFAKGLYAKYLENKDVFVGKYNELLKATGCNNIVDTAKTMGIDVRSKDFWKASLDLIGKDIEKFLQL